MAAAATGSVPPPRSWRARAWSIIARASSAGGAEARPAVRSTARKESRRSGTGSLPVEQIDESGMGGFPCLGRQRPLDRRLPGTRKNAVDLRGWLGPSGTWNMLGLLVPEQQGQAVGPRCDLGCQRREAPGQCFKERGWEGLQAEFLSQQAGTQQAQPHRLAVEQTITGGRFQGMAQGVAEIQESPLARLAGIAVYHTSLVGQGPLHPGDLHRPVLQHLGGPAHLALDERRLDQFPATVRQVPGRQALQE